MPALAVGEKYLFIVTMMLNGLKKIVLMTLIFNFNTNAI